jgi:hypothetical protein
MDDTRVFLKGLADHYDLVSCPPASVPENATAYIVDVRQPKIGLLVPKEGQVIVIADDTSSVTAVNLPRKPLLIIKANTSPESMLDQVRHIISAELGATNDNAEDGIDPMEVVEADLVEDDEVPGEPSASGITSILAVVEEHKDKSGALCFLNEAGKEVGDIILNNGKICLVAGVPSVPRLGDLLTSTHPEYAVVVTEALSKARKEKRMLGEVILGIGNLPAAYLRSCLLQQVALGVLEMSKHFSSKRPNVKLKTVAGYPDNDLTFTGTEAYLEAAYSLGTAEEGVATRVFGEFCGLAKSAMLFKHGNERLWPISIQGIEVQSLADMWKLTRHARPKGEMATEDLTTPKLMSMGPPSHRVIWIADATHTAVIAGLEPADETRVLSRAFSHIRKLHGSKAEQEARLNQ